MKNIISFLLILLSSISFAQPQLNYSDQASLETLHSRFNYNKLFAERTFKDSNQAVAVPYNYYGYTEVMVSFPSRIIKNGVTVRVRPIGMLNYGGEVKICENQFLYGRGYFHNGRFFVEINRVDSAIGGDFFVSLDLFDYVDLRKGLVIVKKKGNAFENVAITASAKIFIGEFTATIKKEEPGSKGNTKSSDDDYAMILKSDTEIRAFIIANYSNYNRDVQPNDTVIQSLDTSADL